MKDWLGPERLDRGYVIVLPGIEGYSRLNRGIARGLHDASVPYGIEIFDWTAGPLAGLYNLRSRRLHQAQADVLRQKIVSYRESHPGRPVYLIGHSGGGAMSLFTAEGLSDSQSVTGLVLIVPAISPGYPLAPALAHVERGIWHYRSLGDCIYLGVLTTLFGTCDGRHLPAAGALGFRKPVDPRVHELSYRAAMLKDWNTGGHLTCTNRRFVRKWIAPLILDEPAPTAAT